MTFIDDMVRSAQKPKTRLGKTVEEHKRRRAEAIAPTEAILAEIEGLINQGNYSEAYRKYEELPTGDQMAIAVSPAVGDMLAMYEVPEFSSRAMQNIQEGDYWGAAGNFGLAGLAGISLIPGFGFVGDVTKSGIKSLGRTAKIPEGEGMGVGGSGPLNIDPAPSKVETTHLKDNQVSETQDSSWMSLLQDRILKTVDTRNLDPDKPYSFQFIKESVLKDNPPALQTKLNKQFTDYTSEGIEGGGKITFRELISDVSKNEPSFYENISEGPRVDWPSTYLGREEYTPRFLNPKADEGVLDYVAPSEYVERNLSVIPANLTEGQLKNMPTPEDFHEMIGQSPYTRLDGSVDTEPYRKTRPADPNRIYHSRSGIYDFGEQGKKYVAAEHQSDMYGFYNKTSELTHLQDWTTKSDHFDNLRRTHEEDELYDLFGDVRVNLEEELIKNPEEAIKVMDDILREGADPEEAVKAIRGIAGDVDRKTTEEMYKKLDLPYRGETEFTPETISNTWRNMTREERLAHAQRAEADILDKWDGYSGDTASMDEVHMALLEDPDQLLFSSINFGPITENNTVLALRRNFSNKNLEYDSSTPYMLQAEHPRYTTPEAPWYDNFDPLLQRTRRSMSKDANKQLEKYFNLELPESRAPLFDEWFNLSVKRNLNHAANSDANSILFPIDAKSVRRQRGDGISVTEAGENMAQTYKSRTENALKKIAAEYDINLTEHLGRFEDPQGGAYIELTLTPELREAFQKTLYNKGGAVYKVPLMNLKY